MPPKKTAAKNPRCACALVGAQIGIDHDTMHYQLDRAGPIGTEINNFLAEKGIDPIAALAAIRIAWHLVISAAPDRAHGEKMGEAIEALVDRAHLRSEGPPR